LISWSVIQFKEAIYQYAGIEQDLLKRKLRRLWSELEKYIESDPEFRSSLIPLIRENIQSPLINELIQASEIAGTGPMAGIAGCFAEQLCSQSSGSSCAVNNGGDIYLSLDETVTLGLWAGNNSPFNSLALKVTKEFMPAAFCSSSGKMGHSFSKGSCDLAMISASSGALADCVATEAANRVWNERDLQNVSDEINSMEGISGGLLIKNKSISLFGKMPELIKIENGNLKNRIMVYNAPYLT